MPPPSEEKSLLRRFSDYSQLAFALPTATVVGYAIGYYVDKWLGTTFFWLVFLLIGIAAGLLQVVRTVNRDKS
ncbi:MAG TPA: AtpZ/AtpI family protein [Bryobacteraceae bacterium]|nr:AtpZ/AtpI family protein [Bryobacteraceae bacterium]